MPPSPIFLTAFQQQRLSDVFDPVELRDEATSTNEIARALRLFRRPALVSAHRQTAGRGRKGNLWVSKGGDVTFTVAQPIPGEAMEDRPSVLPLLVGLEVARALRRLPGVPVVLKWPNDLWVNEMKVGGILVERGMDRYLVGVGINVSESPSLPPEAVPATCLDRNTQQAVDRNAVLVECALATASALQNYREHRHFPRKDYLALFPFLGRSVTMETSSGVLQGTILDVDENGALVVNTGTQSIRCTSGEVRHVRSNP